MKLSLLIPVLNEEENVAPLIAAVDAAFVAEQGTELEFVFVDDGSRDATYSIVAGISQRDPRVKIVRLSRNFGSHPALLAAFTYCTGDAAAYLAADLQDPPAVLCEMLKKWREGIPVVWGQRITRDEPLSQKLFAQFYYQLMRRYALPQIPSGGLDTCMIDRKVIDSIVSMREKNTSIFGLILWSGFSQAFVSYERGQRQRGVSRWTLGKKIKLVVDSFVAFSFAPIRLVTYLGLSFAFLGFAYGVLTMIRAMLGYTAVEGWASLITVVVFLSGVQLLMLGIVAEYLWRTFDESRGRPPFLVHETAGFTAAPSPRS
ncbi:MAG TPA: glycosyltransferase family 2 protein [Prosthecobacter sp.]